jgi:hypothetical protein
MMASPGMASAPAISDASEDFYIVVNHYGRFGTAFAETDLDRARMSRTPSRWKYCAASV